MFYSSSSSLSLSSSSLSSSLSLSQTLFSFSFFSYRVIFLSCSLKKSYCGQENKARSLGEAVFESPMTDVNSNVFLDASEHLYLRGSVRPSVRNVFVLFRENGFFNAKMGKR